MKSNIVCVLAAVTLFISSCTTTTEVVGVWKDDTFVIVPMKKVMVVAVFKEEQTRIAVENMLVKELNKNGGKAFPSYKVFHIDKVTDKAFIAGKLKEIKADSILFTRITDRYKIGSYIPGEIYDTPPDYYHNLYTFSEKMYNDIIAVGYLSPLEKRSSSFKHEAYSTETNMYSAETEKLIITVTTDTEFLQRNERVVEGLAETIVKHLSQQNIVVN